MSFSFRVSNNVDRSSGHPTMRDIEFQVGGVGIPEWFTVEPIPIPAPPPKITMLIPPWLTNGYVNTTRIMSYYNYLGFYHARRLKYLKRKGLDSTEEEKTYKFIETVLALRRAKNRSRS